VNGIDRFFKKIFFQHAGRSRKLSKAAGTFGATQVA